MMALFTRSALLGLVVTMAGCSYPGDRLRDVTDILDLKIGTGIAAGVKGELTNYFGVGAGLGVLGYTREWYGRRSYETYGGSFMHLGIMGIDGGTGMFHQKDGDQSYADLYFVFVNTSAFADHFGNRDTVYAVAFQRPPGFEPVPVFDRFRLGAEFLIPGLTFGLYLNLPEIVDLVGGIFFWDPASDDGIGKFELYGTPEQRMVDPETLDFGFPTFRHSDEGLDPDQDIDDF
ncbi:MAG: hypothetical protein ACI9EF_001682 [Pseudohongiellaceae bacterium]|jgi:hypothetical protein